jgi:hypothetical protein
VRLSGRRPLRPQSYFHRAQPSSRRAVLACYFGQYRLDQEIAGEQSAWQRVCLRPPAERCPPDCRRKTRSSGLAAPPLGPFKFKARPPRLAASLFFKKPFKRGCAELHDRMMVGIRTGRS